ncbi:MAG: hypothetical protein C0423_16900 [Methylibium sp.]|nr:hypothetical protein [Methylibium sp.]
MASSPKAATLSDVPRVGTWRILLILLAVMIALPAFVMGAELGHSLGAQRALVAALGGAAILAVIAGLGGAAGAYHRASTYELIQEAFGEQGAKLANGLLGLSILGWYGVVATMLSHALASTAPALATLPSWSLALAGCALTTLTAMIGFRALDLLSAITTPLKLALLIWTFFAAAQGGLGQAWTYRPATELPLGSGISMVAGGLMVGAVLSPDIARFARAPWQAALGCALAFGLGFPAVLMLAGIPSLVSAERDLVKIMLMLGLGVPAMLTVVLTAWSTNAFNLYSASLIGATLRPRQPSWQLALIAGLSGTALGLAGISDMLVPYLLLLGIAIPPIAGIYLVSAALRRQHWRTPRAWHGDALLAWAFASGWAALAPRWSLALSPVAALDSLLVSALVYALMRRMGRSGTAEAAKV